MYRLYSNKQWKKDIELICNMTSELTELSGKTVLITGATGLICSAVIDIFLHYNETHHAPIDIIAAGRSPEKIKERFGPYCEKKYFHFLKYDASKSDNELTLPCTYIIHGASNATPDKMFKEPVETMQSNFTGLYYLFKYAKETGAEKLLYISSSEIYGIKQDNLPYKENEYGYIDILNPRNSYSMGKRSGETLCSAFTSEYGVQSVIVRPGHIYGPTASQEDSRVSSAWAYMAATGKEIVMKSDGMQVRSYCYCLDCASAIIKVMIKGKTSSAYNISNPDSIISIRCMAELLAKAGGVNLIRMDASDDEKRRFNPMSNSSLDSSRLQELGWKGVFSAEVGFYHTVSIIRQLLRGEE